MNRIRAAALASVAILLAAPQAAGQGFQGQAIILQPTTPGHCVKIAPQGQNYVADSGASCGGGAGGVSSFNARTGAVVPATNDYSFGQLSGTVGAAQLPLPGAASLGGVFSKAAVAHDFLTSISSADGSVGQARPACADLSDAGSGCSGSASAVGANPTATIGATAVSGVAATFMRSDAAPALPAILPALNGSLLTSLSGANITAGSVANAALTNSATTVNGSSCALGGSCTAAAAAGTLTGSALASGVTTSSLTSVGTLAGLTVTGSFTATGLVTNADLANSSLTVAGHTISLGGSSSVACADLSNGATGCSTVVGTAATASTGTSGATLPFLNGANTWSGVQSVNSGDLALKGATSGTVTLNAAAIAGTSTITLPGGTTDFSATGGTSQVVKQTSTGAALTVARLACADLSDSGSGCSGAASAVGANPTGTIGASAVNGSATTFMRSDAAPALPATLPALSGVNLTALNATQLTSGTVPAARLPVPTASTLGGVESLAAVSHNFLTSISTSGVPTQAQPACADLSNAAASCATDATVATNITSGTLPNARISALPNANLANSAVTVNGTSISLGASGTVTAAAGTLTGATLASGVTASSLTSAAGGSFGSNAYTSTAYSPLASPTFTGTVSINGLLQGSPTYSIAALGNADITAAFGNTMILVVVDGSAGGNDFVDLVTWRYFGTAPTVVSSGNLSGTPPTRTYTNSGAGYLNLLLGSAVGGPWTIRVTPLGGF